MSECIGMSHATFLMCPLLRSGIVGSLEEPDAMFQPYRARCQLHLSMMMKCAHSIGSQEISIKLPMSFLFYMNQMKGKLSCVCLKRCASMRVLRVHQFVKSCAGSWCMALCIWQDTIMPNETSGLPWNQ